jgi:hypothetical protein
LWITTAFLVLSLAVYVINEPIGGRNGGTVLGYTFGTISACAIVWLMAFGLRKRAYSSSLGTVEGWLAAHVWIGLGLVLLVPLHAGFSFGCNVHTAAYILMLLTIATGIWGAANYSRLSSKISSHRGGRKQADVLAEVFSIDEEIDRASVGKSDVFLQLVNGLDFSVKLSLWSIFSGVAVPVVDHVRARSMVVEIVPAEREHAFQVIGLVDKKADLLRGALEEARIKALLRVWLYLHVPISIALCVALAIHILAVFFLW